MSAATVLWIDASAGVAGDMLLGALVDAGVPLQQVQRCIEAVVPGSVRLVAQEVTRAGLRATKVEVEVLAEDPPHRSWAAVRELLRTADLPEGVRTRALAVFGRLAEAEARVHGTSAEQVHFHEVGALDAVADVVGSCAGVEALGVQHVVVSPLALGSGTVRAHHGELPVPVPAVLEMSVGWDVLAGGQGELATPTGVALVTALAERPGALPALRVLATGIGAGTRDTAGRANVVRVVLGTTSDARAFPALARTAHEHPHEHPHEHRERTGAPQADAARAVVLEANVDDLDPRLWPVVLERLLAAGAWDAWSAPILMKKGRPAHTLHVLSPPELADALGGIVLEETTTLGVRRTPVTRDVLEREWVGVDVDGERVRIKVGHRRGRVVQAMPEFADVQAAAQRSRSPARAVLTRAHAAAALAGLRAGAPWPVPGPGEPERECDEAAGTS
ncbi:nickel pincer cofactor biosynthesis protein LarC [Kineococcus arenarius]|uniref:nickel pincer cofactor biosynthesis protein LarC n=1 Tax=unclassified Kineococcus TaxID=2621656 RepID=UPI003D7D3198